LRETLSQPVTAPVNVVAFEEDFGSAGRRVVPAVVLMPPEPL